jgi:hypothetical protein
MRLKVLFALLTAAGVVWAAWPTDADAQTRRRGATRVVEDYPGARPRVVRTRTRVTVRRERSFLDPGTTVQPRSYGYTDYALPINSGPDSAYDPSGSRRSPLPNNFDLPFYTRY